MPVFHAHIPAGRFSKEQKRAIGNALNQSLVDALGIPPGDRFIVISEHQEDELFIDPTFMDMNRSADAMIITVQLGAHRPAGDKQKLHAAIPRLLEEAVGISPDDVFTSLIPVPNENFSFGRGIAQLAGIAPRW
ncbi:tautomerase family protein [Burkholderia multivorans]|uniref:tautomerase family protein n=1 Tax=Burkholderia multivorans TaxID=87883 RepID=UPI000CFED181|nr:tautomerase family protein [Burkholderia multivorans]MBH9662134.1 tautomerase family protein [Burkholderia multivorans]MBU9650212.1 tautomerase family protein [Burkholderia multivorans]PRG16942.1 tautomerase family protein [Burkholderia multivorans]